MNTSSNKRVPSANDLKAQISATTAQQIRYIQSVKIATLDRQEINEFENNAKLIPNCDLKIMLQKVIRVRKRQLDPVNLWKSKKSYLDLKHKDKNQSKNLNQQQQAPSLGFIPRFVKIMTSFKLPSFFSNQQGQKYEQLAQNSNSEEKQSFLSKKTEQAPKVLYSAIDSYSKGKFQ